MKTSDSTRNTNQETKKITRSTSGILMMRCKMKAAAVTAAAVVVPASLAADADQVAAAHA